VQLASYRDAAFLYILQRNGGSPLITHMIFSKLTRRIQEKAVRKMSDRKKINMPGKMHGAAT
jgi:hypothetical protein